MKKSTKEKTGSTLNGFNIMSLEEFVDRELSDEPDEKWKNVPAKPSTPPPPGKGNHRPQPRKRGR
jgi:hypothetical protein